MLATSTAFAQMVEGSLHVVEWRVTFDLPGGSTFDNATNAVQSVRIESSTTTDVPDQLREFSGYPTMTATVVLGGYMDAARTMTAEALFRRWNASSPLYATDAIQVPVTVDIGLYPPGSAGVPELLRKFTGSVDSIEVDADGTVTISCIDRSSIFADTVNLSAVAVAAPWNAGLTTEYAMDALLRNASGGAVSSWPKQRAGCVLAVGLRSSMWPEVGVLDPAQNQPVPTFGPGPWGTGITSLPTPPTGFAQPTYQLTASVGSGDVYCQFFVQGVNNSGQVAVIIGNVVGGAVQGINIAVGSTGVQVQFGSGGLTNLVASPDGGPHVVGVHAKYSGGTYSGNIWFDGATAAFSNITSSVGTPFDHAGVVSVIGGASVAALFVTTEANPTPDYPFTPTAVLDPSLNSLDVVPPVSQSPVQELQAMAEAELGVAGFDESGIFRFYNRNSIASRPVARTVSVRNLKAVTEQTLSAAVVNRAQIGFTGWSTAKSGSQLWSLNTVWKIPKRSTGDNAVVRRVTLPSLAVNVPTTVNKEPDLHANGTPGANYYRASLDPSGLNPHPGLTITAQMVTSQRVELTFVNATPQDAYLVADSFSDRPGGGTPVLIIGGQAVTAGAEAFADFQYPPASQGGAKSSRFGEVLWQLSGNAYIQHDDAAAQLAQDAVFDGYVPRPNLTDLQIVADPRVQLLDLLHLVDPDTTRIDEYVRVFAWLFEADTATSWDLTIDGRTLTTPGSVLLDIPGRSELDVPTTVLP